jgi:hypothetical protein
MEPDKHCRAVSDDQADVMQTMLDTDIVAECSPQPKSRPETVNDAYPLNGKFKKLPDTTAESKVKMGLPVPETTATVTPELANMSAKALDRQATVVADDHDDVKHTPRSPPPPRSSPAVAVCSPNPKLRPETVTEE